MLPFELSSLHVGQRIDDELWSGNASASCLDRSSQGATNTTQSSVKSLTQGDVHMMLMRRNAQHCSTAFKGGRVVKKTYVNKIFFVIYYG